MLLASCNSLATAVASALPDSVTWEGWMSWGYSHDLGHLHVLAHPSLSIQRAGIYGKCFLMDYSAFVCTHCTYLYKCTHLYASVCICMHLYASVYLFVFQSTSSVSSTPKSLHPMLQRPSVNSNSMVVSCNQICLQTDDSKFARYMPTSMESDIHHTFSRVSSRKSSSLN